MSADLSTYVHLLVQWQATHNLISRHTVGQVWTRHIADCLQLLDDTPAFQHWVDLGSGAGLPGLVVAIACKATGQRFTLIEANGKKAAFLRAAIRETGANAVVAAQRIEAVGTALAASAEIVSARALAPLPELLALAAPYIAPGGVIVLQKGADFAPECDAATQSWHFDVVSRPSVTDSAGHVVHIRNLRAKAERR